MTEETKKNEQNIEKLDIFTIGMYCKGGRFDTVGILYSY